MFFRSFLVFIAFVAAMATAHGQVNPADTRSGGEVKAGNEKAAIQPQETDQNVTHVDGILALSGYLGKKLLKELGARMNLDETTRSENSTPTKVVIHVGPFKVERFDTL